MTNDTTTLNGALAELGETMADNLVAMGVTDATASDGLTTLANKILQIPTHDVYTLQLASDKAILSYADSESASLTAIVTKNGSRASGQTVTMKVYDSTQTTLLDTLTVTDNNNGTYTASYSSAGVGDIVVVAECMNLEKKYSIEDCTYFRTTSYTISSTTLNIQLPSNFTLEYVIKQGDTGSSVPYLDIGDSSNNRMLVGQYARAGGNGLIIYKSTTTTHAYGTNTTPNTENTIWFKYDSTKYYYKLNKGAIMEVADANVTLTKLIHIEGAGYGQNYLKNIKIKPL